MFGPALYRSTLGTLSLMFVFSLFATSALAQSRAEDDIAEAAAKAKVEKMTANAGYSITKTGFGSADRVIDAGTMYTFRIEGFLARTVLDHMTPTNVVDLEGKLVPPAKGFVASFGASGDVQQINMGDRYYLHAVEADGNDLVFAFLSVNTTEFVNKGASSDVRKALGDPDKGVRFDNKTILYFKGVTLTLIDGKVTGVE